MLTDVTLLGAADSLMKALNDVLVDGRFKLPSAITSTARVLAVNQLEWASKDENKAMLQSFAEETTYSLPGHSIWLKNEVVTPTERENIG